MPSKSKYICLYLSNIDIIVFILYVLEYNVISIYIKAFIIFMKNFILYCLPIDLVVSQDLEAIEKYNYFKAIVSYIDGNTVYIQRLLYKNIDFEYIKPGTTLELHRFKYLSRYLLNGIWTQVDPKLKNIKLITKIPTNEI